MASFAPKAAAFAVAGAVSHNRCAMTNISWIVDGPQLEKKLGMRRVQMIWNLNMVMR